MAKDNGKMEKLISLAKRRGFIYQGSEIYGGLAGMWDYGPMGIALKKNITDLFWNRFVEKRNDIYGVDAAILMNQKVWQASGHVDGFFDPLVECKECKKRYRSDHLMEDQQVDEMKDLKCPSCSGELGEEKKFNMMFETSVGAIKDSSSVSYLRPETAQGIFSNFKNVSDTFHPKLPFGIAQIGKAFRNEIAPRDFIFRTREFEQMEIEWFIKEEDWEMYFEEWRDKMWDWMSAIGLEKKKIHELEVEGDDLAHYSKRTIDFEYDYPFGKKELYGLAYRTDHDLKKHMEASGVDLTYFDEQSGERYLPHVIEPSLGIERTILAVLDSAYTEEKVGDDTRVVLKFEKSVAPVKIAVLPLMRKEDLTKEAKNIYDTLKNDFLVQYDETASIGKRYRRQDEIGTPFCLTVDYDSLEDKAVTVRDRDTMKQERIEIAKLTEYFKQKFS